MADRTSARLFAELFEYLAENPDDRSKQFAAKPYGMSGGYDFNDYQMSCDEALQKLDLLRDGPPDPRWPDDGPTRIYGPAPTDAP